MSAATSSPAVRVLVAEPDAVARSVYRRALIGYELVEVVDGREALQQTRLNPPALIIVELKMPTIDGTALCEMWRRDRSTSDVPIVVVTDETDVAALEAARRAGANVVLSKPLPMTIVVQEVRRLLAKS